MRVAIDRLLNEIEEALDKDEKEKARGLIKALAIIAEQGYEASYPVYPITYPTWSPFSPFTVTSETTPKHGHCTRFGCSQEKIPCQGFCGNPENKQ